MRTFIATKDALRSFRRIPLAMVIALLASGCDAPDPGADGNHADSYIGPGSVWTAQLNPDRSFMLLHFTDPAQMTADQLINGNAGTSMTGFTPLTVTSSAGTGQPNEGAQGYALVVPGLLFALSPFAGTGSWIPMVPTGTCPQAAMTANLIKVKAAVDWSPATSDVSATFSFDPSSGVAVMPSRYNLTMTVLPGGLLPMGAGGCTGGIANPSGGAALFLTESGDAVVHTQPQAEDAQQDEVYLALPQTPQPIDPTTLAGDYAGLVFTQRATPEDIPVSLTLVAATGGVSGAATVLTDVNSGKTGTPSAQLVLNAGGAANGFVTGTIDTTGPNGGGTPQPLTCVVRPKADDAPQIVACAGTDQAMHFVSILLVGR